MTSLAFILGVMPLVISSGAGSGAQNAVGTSVMGGMVTATVLAIFFVPVFFVVVRRRFSRKNEDIELCAHKLSITKTLSPKDHASALFIPLPTILKRLLLIIH